MKASALIQRLREFIDLHGDLEVGVVNSEYFTAEDISKITVSNANFDAEFPAFCDDESLGDRFITIE